MESLRQQPEKVAGYSVWRHACRGLELAFVGRGAPAERAEILGRGLGLALPVSWSRQVHGATCLEAAAGCVGEADALVCARRGLALAISTADCVPIVLAAGDRFAVIHAGWRGIVAGVVVAAAERLQTASRGAAAWIGPAIGPCCYEVGGDVARRVAAAVGSRRVVSAADPAAPRLDLSAAVRLQLAAAGVDAVDAVRACTRCRPDLHSYRRDGAAAGRNLTFAWLADHA
ncbi:MAG: polyphenol oxidase family protein [Acidobacteriota bacterium]|nr:polyphenol oxidase family protein [Acidobacteriota bacterium]MDH3523228.1 polyphenol oxidase family protein [Acidobacteriota bacterium]